MEDCLVDIKKNEIDFSRIEQDIKPKPKILDEYTCNLIVVCLISFSQGISGFPDLAINYMYKDDFHLTPAAVTSITSIVMIPWWFKPLYGFISDSFPIIGFRRKPYLLIFTIVTISALFGLAFLAINIYVFVGIIVVYQISIAFNNVIAEALVVETSRKQSKKDQYAASKNVFTFFFIRSFGYLLTSLCSGLLLEVLNKKYIFVISSLFPLLILISAFFLQEKRIVNKKKIIVTQHEKSNPLYEQYGFDKETIKEINSDITGVKEEEITMKSQFLRVYEIAKVNAVFKAIIFLAIYSITPSYSLILFFFYSNELKFSSGEIGMIKMVYGLAVMIGMVIFNMFLKKVKFRNIMLTSTFLDIVFNLNMIVLVKHYNRSIGIPDFIYSVIGESLLNSTNEIMTMPILILVCHLCPKNVEGTLYALFMGIMNAGYFVAGQLSALLANAYGVSESNFEKLSYLIITICGWLILTIIATFIIDEKKYKKPISIKKERKKRKSVTDLLNINYNDIIMEYKDEERSKSEFGN